MRGRHRRECMCALNLERDRIHAATAAPRTLGLSRPQRTSTLYVRYALLTDHPKEVKPSDAQLQLRLRLDEVLPRRANPQPRTQKRREPRSPILEDKNLSVSRRRLASAGARMGTPLDACSLLLASISISCRRHLFHRIHAIDSVGAYCTTALVSPPPPPPPPH
ncbi:hypothetical protein B0H14DRAFT_2870199 [Mycena olivaceomarginata]|nr:hypothetical protein B0H14DRAFT_2870199 [Mycena olivaceomarginata]